MASHTGQVTTPHHSEALRLNSSNLVLNLPSEILQNILRRVDAVSVLAVRATCRTLRSEVDYLSPVDLKNIQSAFIQIHPFPRPGQSAVSLTPLGQKLLIGSPLISKHQLGFVLKNLPLIKLALKNTNLTHETLMGFHGDLVKSYPNINKENENLINDIEHLIAGHPSLDSISLESPTVEKHLNEIIENPGTTGELLHKLVEKHQDDDFILAAIAGHPHLQANTAKELYELHNPMITGFLAENDATPSDILDSICRDSLADGDMIMLADLAKNTSCTPKTLQLIWDNTDKHNLDIRMNLAENPSIPDALFTIIMNQPELHQCLAQNPHLPTKHVNSLLQSTDNNVRYSLAQNEHLLGVADTLAGEDQPVTVRAAAASNPQLSDAMMDTLLKTGIKEILVGLTNNPDLEPKMMNTLALHEDKEVSSSAALSPKLTESTLNILSRSTEPKIQESLVVNKTMQLYFSRIYSTNK
ncbi:MAG: F-box protein [Pseudomonadota bacterium]|nr:F-box protein [Pseudomonadota bacterium]